MRHKLILTGLLVLGVVPLSAQQGPPRGGNMTMKIPDPILFNGPPPPEDFLDLVGLDSTQYDSYRMHYSAFMDQTRAQRDSLLEFRSQMRQAFETGNVRPGGQRGGGELQKTMAELEKRQKEFDETLKTVLHEAQLKRYEAWRKEELIKAERDFRERYGGRPQ